MPRNNPSAYKTTKVKAGKRSVLKKPKSPPKKLKRRKAIGEATTTTNLKRRLAIRRESINKK